jgi:hypothetical protein
MPETTESTTVKVTIELLGETREVEAEGYVSHHGDDRQGTIWRAPVPGLVATIGRGSARYPSTLLLDRLYDGDRNRPGTHKVTDTEGRTWTYHLGTCVRNRQAWITGWADVAGVTNAVDQTRTEA